MCQLTQLSHTFPEFYAQNGKKVWLNWVSHCIWTKWIRKSISYSLWLNRMESILMAQAKAETHLYSNNLLLKMNVQINVAVVCSETKQPGEATWSLMWFIYKRTKIICCPVQLIPVQRRMEVSWTELWPPVIVDYHELPVDRLLICFYI